MEAKGAAKDKSFLEERFLVRSCQSSLQDHDTGGPTEQKRSNEPEAVVVHSSEWNGG